MGALQLSSEPWILASGSAPPSLSFPPYCVPEANGGSGSGSTMTHLEQSQGCCPSPRGPSGGWGGEKEVGSGAVFRRLLLLGPFSLGLR